MDRKFIVDMQKKRKAVYQEIESGIWEGNDLEQMKGFLNGLDYVLEKLELEVQ